MYRESGGATAKLPMHKRNIGIWNACIHPVVRLSCIIDEPPLAKNRNISLE
jgi:hypothetical protein